MKKSYLIMATIASVALVSCSNEEFYGDPGGLTGERAISFDMSTPAMTRDETGEAAATKLGYSFQVYATKTLGTGETAVTSNVFAHNAHSTTSNTPYWAWYLENTAGKTNSNLNNWEYVGAAGNHGTATLSADQTIKYWDHSAASYTFMAFKAKPVGTTDPAAAQITNVTSDGFTVKGTPAQLAELYVAKKEIITNTAATPGGNVYDSPVKFTFRNFVSKIRFGIYENIPGYKVKIDKVYYPVTNEEGAGSNTEFGVKGSFSGATATQYTYDVTYGDDGIAKGAHTSGDAQTYLQTTTGGSPILTDDAIGETATLATYDQAEKAYSIIMPNPSNTTGMTLKVDVTLTSEGGSGETIKLTKASATVPANYCQWQSNYAYTYLFKISDLTQFNGELLVPITLDAVVTDDGQGNQNTITVVETPSITTYQNGAIANDYATAGGDIFVTVENANGALLPLMEGTTQKAALYTFEGDHTEAEILKALNVRTSALAATPIVGRNGITLTAATMSLTDKIIAQSGEISVGTNNAAKFTPAASTNYAFVYTQTAPTTTTAKYEVKSFTENTSVTGYYCKYDFVAATAGDAQVGTAYYNNTYDRTELFCGQTGTGLYVLNGSNYEPFTGKVQTGGTYYLIAEATSPASIEGLLELSEGNYVPTTDTSVDNGKTYYSATQIAAARLIAFDNFSTVYKKTGETTYEQVSSDDVTNGPSATTEYYSDGTSATRVYILPQQRDGYYITQDNTTEGYYRLCVANEKAIAGKRYYEKYDENVGEYAVKVIKVQ